MNVCHTHQHRASIGIPAAPAAKPAQPDDDDDDAQGAHRDDGDEEDDVLLEQRRLGSPLFDRHLASLVDVNQLQVHLSVKYMYILRQNQGRRRNGLNGGVGGAVYKGR